MSKNIRAPHGIDLNAPGGLAALFALHRGTFGDATMSAAPAEGGAAPVAPVVTPAAPAATPAAAAPVAPVAPAVAPVVPAAENVEDLPAWAQKLITEGRDEAAKHRTGKTAAEQQLAALTQILNPDAPGGTPVDPAALTQALAERDTELRTLKVDNALGTSLVTAGADPLTLAVLKGEGKLNDLDPNAATFQADVDAIIKDALTRHPKLKAVQAATKSSASFSGGPGEHSAKSPSLTAAVNQHYGN